MQNVHARITAMWGQPSATLSMQQASSLASRCMHMSAPHINGVRAQGGQVPRQCAFIDGSGVKDTEPECPTGLDTCCPPVPRQPKR